MLKRSRHNIGRVLVALLTVALLCLSACSTQAKSDLGEGHEDLTTGAFRHNAAAVVRADRYDNAFEGKLASVSPKDAALKPQVQIAPKSKRYTLMIYMIGSNLESQNAAATEDLQEMLESGIDFAKANVVVYAGGAKRWNSKIPADCNSVVDVSLSADDWVVAQTESVVSMGAPETLASFVNFCADNYPAEHSALVFWDHGGGPLFGYGYDELNEGDGLLLSELRQAMDDTPFSRGGSKLDWVGFDACLMGSMENAALWRDYADWLVASEEVEPGAGWDYSFISKLNGTVQARSICKAAVSSFGSWYERSASAFSNPDVTLAAYDLSKTDTVISALDDLMGVLDDDIGNGGYAELSRARRSSKAFGLAAVESRAASYDLVDMANFADNVAELHPDEAKALCDAVSSFVVERSTNIDDACGVSLYLPGDNRELYQAFRLLESERQPAAADDGSVRAADADPGDKNIGSDDHAGAGAIEAVGGGALLSLTDSYDKFVSSFTSEWLAASKVDWSSLQATADASGVTLQLAEEQKQACASTTYTLFSRNEPDSYIVHMADVELPLDEFGFVRVPADPTVITISSDLAGEQPAFFQQVDSSSAGNRYLDDILTLYAAGDFTYSDSTDEDFSLIVRADDKTGAISVASIDVSDSAVGVGGRGGVDVGRYSHVRQPDYRVSPRYDEHGRVLAWDEWAQSTGSAVVLPLESEFGFSAKTVSEIGGTWACQIVVTDVNGERHALAPVDLTLREVGSSKAQAAERATDLGKMTFTIQGGHAELTKYEGEDWTVDIPAEIEGVPVTAIGNSAFSRCRYLDELVVPEGITSIGQSAFAETGLYSISLPSTLTHIAPAAFREMPYLEAFAVSGENPVVVEKGGVLFSADGKTLVAYPNAKGKRYTVPKGVEAIGYGAFAETGVTVVELPEGLKTIDRAAFFGCSELRAVEFPRSLESIGTAAFAWSGSWSGSSDARAAVDSVVIGPNVSYIGARAFSGLALRSIDVDAGNERYSSRGGMLLNAAGDTLIEVPRGDLSLAVVPEGVVALDAHAFSDFPEGSDIVLPISIVRCETSCFPYQSGDDAYRCTVHAPEGSFALRFAEENGIPCDANTDSSSLAHDSITIEQSGYALTFSVYRDHAKLVTLGNVADYSRMEHALIIPDEVLGIPVTDIDLNTGYEYAIETLTLPASLSFLGTHGLETLNGLKHLELDSSNKHFKLVDGALLTADSKEIVAYPKDRDEPFAIPDGVELIRTFAFNGCKLSSIDIPSSVTEIGDSAFSDSESLERVGFAQGLEMIGDYAFEGCKKLRIDEPFPESLISVGSSAFAGVANFEGLALPQGLERLGQNAFWGYSSDDGEGLRHVEQPVISVGPYLEDMDEVHSRGLNGADQFSGLDVRGFSVAPENDAYRAEGPFLLTKDGREVVCFADGFEGDAWIPEGVQTLNGSVLEGATKVTSFHIPDSVVVLSWPVSETTSNALKPVEVHVNAGSYAERYARERGLPWIVD